MSKKTIVLFIVCSMLWGMVPLEGETLVQASSTPPMELTGFHFDGMSSVTSHVYESGKYKLTVTIPRYTEKTSLVAKYNKPQNLKEIKVNGGAENYGSARDFSNPVTYTFIKNDGRKLDYIVTVDNSNSNYPEVRLTNFDFRDVDTRVNYDYRQRKIEVEVPYGTSLRSLRATFSVTGSADVYVGNTRQVSGQTYQDFWNPVTYRVRTSDSNYVDYTVTVRESSRVGSSERRITDFGFRNIRTTREIDQTRKVIKVYVPFNTNLRNLVATFDYEGKEVTVNGRRQISGEDAHDFSYEVLYRVYAQNGEYDEYRVIVQEEPEFRERAITEFSFRNLSPTAYGVINERDKRITVTVPRNTNLRNLVASFEYRGDRVTVDGRTQYSGSTVNDFTRTVVYRVTDRDGRWVEYEVEVRESTSSSVGKNSKRITEFSFRDLRPRVDAKIDQDAKWILLVVPNGTNLRNLVATFRHDGEEVRVDGRRQSSGSTSNDFRDPLIYRVIAEDGSYQEYTVVVQEEPRYTNKAITEFTFNELRPKVYGVIYENDQRIKVDVPRGTNLRNLVASFKYKGKEVTVDGRTQNSGRTANDFSSTVVYRVTAQDGSWIEYKVDVNETDYYPGRDKQITSFSFRNFSPVIYGDIDHDRREIRVRLPYGTNLRNLVATFGHTGDRVTVDGRTQHSGSTANDFSSTVYYRVIARDGSYEEYRVIVSDGRVDSTYPSEPYKRYDPLEPSAPFPYFGDMASHWALVHVRELADRGAISGYPDGQFKPEQSMTRAEFVSILVHAFELELRYGQPPKYGKIFEDTKSHWAGSSISTAYSYGIINGYNSNYFGPNDPVTREQIAAMLVEVTNRAQVVNPRVTFDTHKFKDQSHISPWAGKLLATAIENGLITGYPDQTIRPKHYATRAEAVTMIVRALRLN